MFRLKKKYVFLFFVCAVVGLGFSGFSNANSDGLKLAWSFETGKAINFDPVVAGNRLLVIPDGGPLMAFDISTGKVQWEYEPDEGVWNRGFQSDGERVFVCIRGGELAALKVSDGELLWKIDLGINCQRQAFVSGDTIFVPTTFVGPGLPGTPLTGAKLFSINASDGQINWTYTSDDYVLQTPYSTEGTVYVGGSYIDPNFDADEGGTARFYALDSESGQLKWIHNSIAGLPKALYATDERLVFISYEDFLFALDTANGKLIWKRNTGNWVPSLSGFGNVVYFGSANTFVHAWDTLTGKPRWKFNIPGGPFDYLMRKPIFQDDRVYFISQRGTVYALDREDGKLLWSQSTGLDSRGLNVISRTLFIGDSKGRVSTYKVLR